MRSARNRQLERDTVVALFRPHDERVVGTVIEHRDATRDYIECASKQNASCAFTRYRSSSHDSRDKWWISRALRVECLTFLREYVLITRTHTARGGLF
jgi:hypothetical protein